MRNTDGIVYVIPLAHLFGWVAPSADWARRKAASVSTAGTNRRPTNRDAPEGANHDPGYDYRLCARGRRGQRRRRGAARPRARCGPAVLRAAALGVRRGRHRPRRRQAGAPRDGRLRRRDRLRRAQAEAGRVAGPAGDQGRAGHRRGPSRHRCPGCTGGRGGPGDARGRRRGRLRQLRRGARHHRPGSRLPHRDRPRRAAQRRAGGRAREADRGGALRRGEAAPRDRRGDRQASPPRCAATCASSSPTASGRRTTCSRRTSGWSSRSPSATRARA